MLGTLTIYRPHRYTQIYIPTTQVIQACTVSFKILNSSSNCFSAYVWLNFTKLKYKNWQSYSGVSSESIYFLLSKLLPPVSTSSVVWSSCRMILFICNHLLEYWPVLAFAIDFSIFHGCGDLHSFKISFRFSYVFSPWTWLNLQNMHISFFIYSSVFYYITNFILLAFFKINISLHFFVW